jgi:hypothetical protein
LEALPTRHYTSGTNMTDQATGPAESVSFGIGLSLGAQLAFAGQLLSTLIANKLISEEQAKELLTKVADTITSSLDQPASDFQALAKKPLLEHAEALRKLAADLIPSGA